MNKTHAREYVLRVLAAEVRHHLGNGSEWLERPLGSDNLWVQEDGDFSEADRIRIASAVEEVADALERASLRLAHARLRREARALRRKAEKVGG